jgi:hypothetical protein
LRDFDGLLRGLLHAFLSGVGQRDSLFQKCDCGFGAGGGVLREIFDERLNLAADRLVPRIDDLCQLRLCGRRNLGNLAFVRQDLLGRVQRQRVLQTGNFLSVLFCQPVLRALLPIGKRVFAVSRFSLTSFSSPSSIVPARPKKKSRLACWTVAACP